MQNTRHKAAVALQLLALFAVALVSLATDTAGRPCVAGGRPFDGETAVPLDRPITLHMPDVDDDAPRLGNNLVGLRQVLADGRESLVSLTLHRAGQAEDGSIVWEVRPDAPLTSDATYFLSGPNVGGLAGHHYQGAGPRFAEQTQDMAYGSKQFTTSSAPRLLMAVAGNLTALPGQALNLTLAFSEPIDAATLTADRVQVRQVAPPVSAADVGHSDVGSSEPPQPLKVLTGPTVDPSHPHLFTLRVDPDDQPAPYEVTLLPGVRATSGLPLRPPLGSTEGPARAQIIGLAPSRATLDRFVGKRSCWR